MTILHDQHGHRKYLTPAERDAFLNAADESEVREVRTFCATLAHTGCRISEALALTADRIDLKDGTIVIESAKKRQTGIYRPIPVPPTLLDMLNLVHDVRAAHKRRDRAETVRLWDWSRILVHRSRSPSIRCPPCGIQAFVVLLQSEALHPLRMDPEYMAELKDRINRWSMHKSGGFRSSRRRGIVPFQRWGQRHSEVRERSF